MLEKFLRFQPTNKKRQKEETSKYVFQVLSESSDETIDSLIETLSIKLPDSVSRVRSAGCNWIMWEILHLKNLT